MTVYTDASLSDYYVDDDGVSDFVDDNGETIIIAAFEETEPEAGPVLFFGYPILWLWQ